MGLPDIKAEINKSPNQKLKSDRVRILSAAATDFLQLPKPTASQSTSHPTWPASARAVSPALSRRSASRSDEPTVAMGLQPMEASWPTTTASRERRVTARRLGECCTALVAQPSLRDGCPSWIFHRGR